MVRVFWTGDATGGYEFDDEDSAWYQVRDRITDTFNVGRLSDAINYEDVTITYDGKPIIGVDLGEPLPPVPAGAKRLTIYVTVRRRRPPVPVESSLLFPDISEPPDFWELSVSDAASSYNSTDQHQFRRAVIAYYQPYNIGKKVDCMILGRNTGEVVAAHLMPSRLKRRSNKWIALGLPRDAESNPRNGLLLDKNIEEAFDQKEICFFYNPFENDKSRRLLLQVLNPALLNKRVVKNDPLKWSELQNRPLILPDDKIPFLRVLNHHARCAFRKAAVQGWINKEQLADLESYDNFSTDSG